MPIDLSKILSEWGKEIVNWLKINGGSLLLAFHCTTLLLYLAHCKLRRKESMKWFFNLSKGQQRLILCLLYFSLFLFFYWLFSTIILDNWFSPLRRLIVPPIDAVESDQEEKEEQRRQRRGKSPATPAADPSQTCSSAKSSQGSKGKGLGGSSGYEKKNKKKTHANDREASSSRGNQKPFSSMQDVVNAGRDECRNVADQVKKLQIFDQKPKQGQRLPAVSHADPGKKVQPTVANYENLGDSPAQAGKNLAKFFSSKGIKKTRDDHGNG